MDAAEAYAVLIRRLEAEDLDPGQLDPWEGWKAFKAFLRLEVDGVHDAASVQASVDAEATPHAASLFLVRQFSNRDYRGVDVSVGRVVIELCYDASVFPTEPRLEVWTHDFATLEEFAAVVEGKAAFQAAMASRPLFTQVSSPEE